MGLMSFHRSNITVKQSAEEIEAFDTIYQDYPNRPFLSPHRDLKKWLDTVETDRQYIVPKKMMETFNDGLFPGDIILLWRVGFNTLHTDSILPQYFEYHYGIDGYERLDVLEKRTFIRRLNPDENLSWHTLPQLKSILKKHQIKSYSKLNKQEMIAKIIKLIPKKEYAQELSICGYKLTAKGEEALKEHNDIVEKHPKKG